LVVVYLFVKLLYLTNIAAQLFLLDMFLGTPFHAYGIEVRACVPGFSTGCGKQSIPLEIFGNFSPTTENF